MLTSRSESPKLDTLQSIELAEGVEIQLCIAGPLTRIMAVLIDTILVWVILAILGVICAIVGFFAGNLMTGGLALLFYFILNWWYPVICEYLWGRPLGKKICGLRVIQTSGAPITLNQAIVRNFLKFIDLQPFFTGLFGITTCLSTQRFQCLGDLAAGTVVIYDAPSLPPSTAAVMLKDESPPPVTLAAHEASALIAYSDRLINWSAKRQQEMADHLQPLSGEKGEKGVLALISMANWLRR